MILIADSGSTKTEWCIVNRGKVVNQILTAGMNPYFQMPDEISCEIKNTLLPSLSCRVEDINAVYFYGAGCAFPDKNKIITDAIHHYIPATIEVQSDLMGAARALCGRQPGIACILGTGSNSCLYDGEKIVRNVSPLGYVLGDEGSGAVLGKLLVGDCLKQQLPKHLADKFMQQYNLTPALLLERVYKQPFPNRFLASLTPFLLENIGEPKIYQLVYNSFLDFLTRNVLQYEGAKGSPIHFAGSIAFYYQEVLKAAIRSLNLQIGTIVKTPMEGLLAYHQKNKYIPITQLPT